MNVKINDRLSRAGIDVAEMLASDNTLDAGSPSISGMENALYIDQIPDLIRWHLMTPELHDHVTLILGPSAIGKTYAIRQGLAAAAQAMGREHILHEEHVSQMGPTDVMGVPREDGHGRTVWFPPRKFALQSAHPEHQKAYDLFLADYQRSGSPDWSLMQRFPLYAYFLDEITNPSNPSIVHQLFSLIYGKFVADHKLVGDAAIIAAGNRVEDRTNSIYLAASATSRMTIMQAVPRFSGWLRSWALQPVTIGGEEHSREHPAVIAYLTRFTEKFAPNSSAAPQMEPFPSPRTWTHVSELLYAHDRNPVSEELLFAAVAGRIGLADARQFWAFRENWRDLPDVNRLLNSRPQGEGAYGWMPRTWPVNRPDLLCIMGTQMVTKLNAGNARRFMAFLNNPELFPPEWTAVPMRLLRPAGKLDALMNDWDEDGFQTWAEANQSLLF